jgi:LuxR family maltose regulon positive regulatory protein
MSAGLEPLTPLSAETGFTVSTAGQPLSWTFSRSSVSNQRGLLIRERLISLLDEAVTNPLTILCAPPGSGKTSLLHTWIERARNDRRIAFVSAQSDGGEQAFWITLLAALQDKYQIPTPSLDVSLIVDRVREALNENQTPTTIVIDDAHELERDSLDRLTLLLRGVGPHVSTIMATRRDLSVGAHRLRVAGVLGEIRANKLAFTEGETRELLSSLDISLSDTAVRTLQLRTEGWAAGLRLAALSLTAESNPEKFVAEFSGSHRVVADYLMAEMLERQPARVQQLLLATSILERVNGELADVLLDETDSDRLLLELEELNAFVVSVDRERRWFRYHNLFREMLRLELRRKSPFSITELHRRAARWFEEQRQFVDAIRHRQAAGDFELAAQLLADNLFDTLLSGREATIRSLLDAFPRSERSLDSELAVVNAAFLLQHGRFAEATTELDVAEQHASTLPRARQSAFRLCIATLKLWLARRQGQLANVVDQVEYLASPEAQHLTSGPTSNVMLRTVALMNLGIVEMWSGRIPDAQKHLREGATLAKTIDQPFLEINCLSYLGFALKFTSYSASRRHAEQTIALAERYGLADQTILIPALTALGGVLVCTGDFNNGEQWLQRAEDIITPDANPGLQLPLHVAKGMLHAGLGQLQAALEEFQSGERMQSLMIGDHVLATQATAFAIATRARLGLLDEARTALAPLPSELVRLVSFRNAGAQIELAANEPRTALDMLSEVLDGPAGAIHDFVLVESQLLAAQAYSLLGNARGTREAIEKALAIAQPERIILPFVMAKVRDPLEKHTRHTAHSAFLLEIVDVISGSSTQSAASSSALSALSPSELRVLRFLPTHLSRQDIARELRVSVNTVNTHLRNIYSKLGAGNRGEAVERAHHMRLLEH